MSLFVAFTMIQLASAAANPCRGVDVPKDQFTGKEYAEVRALFYVDPPVPPYTMMGWSLVFDAGTVSLTVGLTAQGVREEVLPAGYGLDVLLGDDSRLHLQTDSVTNPIHGAGSVVYTEWPVKFVFDLGTAARLAEGDLHAVRAALPEGTRTLMMNNFAQRTFRRAITCFASKAIASPPLTESPPTDAPI